MKRLQISKKDWNRGLENAARSFRLFGPVKEGENFTFKALEAGQEPDTESLNTRLSPKSVVYPQSEILFEYSLDENDPDHHRMKEPPVDDRQRAVVGIRPCDAAAFPIVRRNFDTDEYKDPYWLRAYEATTFIGYACSRPSQTCFCTSAGYGPFSEIGLDLLVVDTGSDYIVSVVTGKGQDFLDAAAVEVTEDEALGEKVAALKAAAEALITSRVPTDNLAAADTQKIYNAAFWEDVAFACINCGTCTYLCPTCWCFDIQDENEGQKGVRMRNWDSCMFPLFTLHGTGHNPRGEKVMRVRQRFMHKLKYYVDRYESGIQCVGCGRCIRSCPVNIDIRTVCEKMNAFARADACAVS